MAEATPIQTSFNGGELSRRLDGRPDLAAYASGVSEMVNIVPLVQGPALKRSGTRLVALAKAQGTAGWLIPFESSITQSYVIEASNLAFRFYTNNVRCESPPGTPVEVVTPYTTATLPSLDWQQSNDVLYLAAGGTIAPRKLSRTGALSFTLGAMTLTGGPFKDLNSDKTVTVYATAGTGSVSLISSVPIFQPGHVGTVFYLEVSDFRDVQAWEPGISVAVGALRRAEAKVYKAITVPSPDARTGTIMPTHTEGRAWDGMYTGTDINTKAAGGVLWEYQYGKYGIATITAFVANVYVTATVTTTLPGNVVSAANACWRWALGAFSDVDGYPQNVRIWNQRMVFATVNRLDSSVVGDFTNFSARNDAGEATADMALSYKLPGADPIAWIVADKPLLAGTLRAEYVLGSVNAQLAVSATNINATSQSYYGSARVRPMQTGNRTLFVQRGQRKLRELGYDFQSDRYVAPDLTTRSPHVTRSSIVQMAMQQEPESLLWAVRGDGALLSFTYSGDQEVRGWSRHVLGGVSDAAGTPAAVESIAVIPSPDGGEDDLWLLVRRWVNGATLRTIERLETFWEEGTDVRDGFFVDCGLSYHGPPVANVGGLNHLIGETVKVLIDGATHPDLVVDSSGSIHFLNGVKGSTVHAGLGFTARLTTMRIEAGADSGTAQGKLKRIVAVTIRMLETLGLRAGQPGRFMDQVNSRKPADPMDTAVPVFTGDRRIGVDSSWDRDGKMVFESSDPLPMMIQALIPDVTTSAQMIIRDFIPDDVLAIDLQAVQLADIGTLDLDYGHRAAIGQAWSAVTGDGRIVACAGILELFPSHGLAWALFAERIGAGLVAITRCAKRAIDESPYRRIEALVRADFADGMHWAMLVGLMPHAVLRAWGPHSADHVLFERIR